MNKFEEMYKDNNTLLPSPYDGRDYHLDSLIPKGSMEIPDTYETECTPFIYDQGNSNECAACSYNTIRFLQEADIENGGSGIPDKFAPSFNYANRPVGEDFEGMYLRTVCSKGREGSIPWNVFPGFYNYAKCKMEFYNNKDKWLEMASDFAITSFYQCTHREQMQQAIMECKGIIAGIPVYDSLYKVGPDGVIHYDPSTDTKNYGGHAITLVGWKIDEDGKMWWRMQNSWGEDWADHGRAWLPEAYPFIENPWAVVDYNISTKWDEYRAKYNL